MSCEQIRQIVQGHIEQTRRASHRDVPLVDG